jgi:cytochrome oxidase assembly protein ShyY1
MASWVWSRVYIFWGEDGDNAPDEKMHLDVYLIRRLFVFVVRSPFVVHSGQHVLVDITYLSDMTSQRSQQPRPSRRSGVTRGQCIRRTEKSWVAQWVPGDP